MMHLTGLAPETLMLLTLAIPFAAALLIPVFHVAPNLRETVTLTAAGLLFFTVLHLVPTALAGARPEAARFEFVDGISFALKLEPLGMLFMLVASTLWIVNSIYSIGYMRGNDEPRQTSFYVCFAIAIASTMGLALSANLVTLFIFYEALTLSTYPLVTHKGNEEARNGGRIYLLILLGTSMLLLLPAIFITYVLAGTTDFTAGGILAGKATPGTIGLLLALFAFGIGKAGLMPFHAWLPAAMVAPTPVSALLHAVAVVKAGVFTVLKVVVYIFGIDTLSAGGQSELLIWVAGGTVIISSLVALTQDNLKKRLAFSTISQLSYIVLGALIATKWAVVGSSLHIATHAVGKITLFFCAGAIYTAAHKTEISDLSGLGRVMPFTFAAFTIGALSIIGLPPFAGMWSKWYLAKGAMDAGMLAVVGVFMLSSLLNIAYLLIIPIKAFLEPLPAAKGSDAHNHQTKIHEAPVACLIAIGLSSLATLLLFFFPGPLLDLILQISLK